jgi:hypothetical protein
MLELRQAVSDSRKYLLEVFDEASNGITLEGVELSEDMKFWLVTFSYWIGTLKKYKTVKLRADDGIVLGIRPSEL